MKKFAAFICSCLMLVSCLSGCAKQNAGNGRNPDPAVSAPITLVISGGWTESPAFEAIAQRFNQKYQNCTVVYEYLQNYDDSLITRFGSQTDKIDLFITNNIQQDSPFFPYALDLFSEKDKLDLTGLHEGLIKNFTFLNSSKDEAAQLYAVPLGAELRGMYVNKTLLSTLGIDVPQNVNELFSACATLSEHGFMPLQASPSYMGQHMMYPYICNIIANAENYEQIYAKVNNCEPGVSELFRDPLQVLYTIVENNYYNYKYVEATYGTFTQLNNDMTAMDFLNIRAEEDGETYTKQDDVGVVAFMPGSLSINSAIAKIKEDYHSEIDYEFILAPVSQEGGLAYMSPASGIAINKNSDHVDWALKFLDFLFEDENNKAYAEISNIIPCTKDAMVYITERFNVPADRICQLGDVSFDYKFYSLINETLIAISKANNPKYMEDDGNGNLSMYSFDYYMDELEVRFAQQRSSNQEAAQ